MDVRKSCHIRGQHCPSACPIWSGKSVVATACLQPFAFSNYWSQVSLMHVAGLLEQNTQNKWAKLTRKKSRNLFIQIIQKFTFHYACFNPHVEDMKYSALLTPMKSLVAERRSIHLLTRKNRPIFFRQIEAVRTTEQSDLFKDQLGSSYNYKQKWDFVVSML